MDNLTPAQRELYDWLVDYIKTTQHAPSIRQMMKAMSGMGMMGRMKAMKQLSNMDMFSGKMPGLKMKQRSKRKRGDRRKKNKRRR